VIHGEYVALIDGLPFGHFTVTDQVAPLEQVRLLAPVIPSKIIGVVTNFADHAAEMVSALPEEPLLFFKPATTVIGPNDTVRLPVLSDEVDYEAELAVVIGAIARHVTAEQATEYVAGYTCGNDVTARDLQRRDGQWARAKGFDTFCPLGPWIETEAEPASGLGIACRLNGELAQSSETSQLVFGVAELVAAVSAFATLLPGDVILTGTPSGVGELTDGDTVEVGVDGVGTLTNPAAQESGARPSR
jgi:2-keto-4-pentenoate hydratase/2-oxohepta-3-ene-1,7-dioic acid hydratase in catechol pathway